MKIYIVLFLIVGFLFYWFQVRPVMIRKVCNEYAYEQAKDTGQKRGIGLKEGWYVTDDRDYAYENCLHNKGLK